MGGLQNDFWSQSCVVGILPSTGAEAPFVAGLQPWKFILWSGRGEVVSLLAGKLQECIGHDCTHSVHASVSVACVAMAITVVSCQWFVAAGLQIAS